MVVSLPLNDIYSAGWLLRLNCLVSEFVAVFSVLSIAEINMTSLMKNGNNRGYKKIEETRFCYV